MVIQQIVIENWLTLSVVRKKSEGKAYRFWRLQHRRNTPAVFRHRHRHRHLATTHRPTTELPLAAYRKLATDGAPQILGIATFK